MARRSSSAFGAKRSVLAAAVLAAGGSLTALDVVESGVTQQRVGGFPVHDHRRFHGSNVLDPLRVYDAKGQHVALGPDGWLDAVEHDEIKPRSGIRQIICRHELHARRCVQCFFD